MTGDDSLQRKRDFQRLYEYGSSYRSKNVVLICERSNDRPFRVGVVASRKVGKAVKRNRAKRWLRAAHRELRAGSHLEGVHLVLIARRSAPTAGFHQIRDEISRLYEHAGLLPPRDS